MDTDELCWSEDWEPSVLQRCRQSGRQYPRAGVHGPLGTGHTAGGEQGKLRMYLQPLPMPRITAWAPPPVRSAAAIDSHRSTNPTVNCACEGSRLHAPYQNLMPDDLRWSWGGDASAGDWLQIQLSLAERFDCTETIINQLLADSYQNPICEWQVTSCISRSRLDISNTRQVSLSPSPPDGTI